MKTDVPTFFVLDGAKALRAAVSSLWGNHWLDCLVGCAVAASMQGRTLMGAELTPRAPRSRLKLSELRRRAG